jgi:hypothetical protein
MELWAFSFTRGTISNQSGWSTSREGGAPRQCSASIAALSG